MAQSCNQLIKEIVKGNEAAMELLVKSNYNMVHSFVYRSVGDYNISYDLTQEIFIKMMKNINKYDYKNGNFTHWILKIASNHYKDYFRSAAYKQRINNKDIDGEEIYADGTVVDILEKNESRKAVKKAVDNLPTLQREAIILKYYNNLKIKEISEVTGFNESTIKSRLFSGMGNLRKIMGGGKREEKDKINKYL
ncbi:RNA polymerase sigma factor [Clostridium tagluense]|uniref:RNA polymerase sigma factor n=1 Tax=Clostridium tagluense TaxID=360422 RepID=UPI001C0B43CA|nr:RNA polymerase sigma factor [Clostridium tagluense]MBU3127221.1 RNA polymerase sigma factor [Clostridium tagluense]MCB2312304.1 RNA polymerase sigma factor [Clostridium tagluense]MCB2316958.1 RNA polymerase sigma factor [Clostridium tagluense]MCB2321843.1 RNA polymerase sigma factor [Clostridium tagluense]MCB2326737.1 RNA polymerase sigma factor [Clostridium tagluense]